MEKHKHPLDEFFREELREFLPEPSAPGREAFLKEAEGLMQRNASRKRWFILLTLLVLLAGSATGIWFLTSPESPALSASADAETPVSPAHTGPASPETGNTSMSSPASPSVSTSSTVNQETSLPPAEIHTVPVPEPAEPAETGVQAAPDMNLSVFSDTLKVPEPAPTATTTQVSTVPEPAISEGSMVTDTTIRKDSIKEASSLTEEKKKNYPQAKKDISILIGAYYTPEWMFNILEGDKYVNNFGLEGTFRFGRYSIRTGAGLSITKGTNEMVVSYNKYKGSYNDLDSITFRWDENHYHLLPTYHMTDQKVWDSLVQQEQYALIKRYTYLQIPLVLGYNFLEKGRFSLGVRAGPVLSLLLDSEPLSAQYDPGQDKVIIINQVTPDRIQTNWQVMGGLNLRFAINRRWDIELEPEARYYFNSVYEKSDITKKPWSIGIRAGVSFDLKK